MCGQPFARVGLIATTLVCVCGCREFPGHVDTKALLGQQMERLITEEEAAWPASATARSTTRELSTVLESVTASAEELDAMGPARASSPLEVQFDPDLTGHEQQELVLTLDGAIMSAVEHNLAIQIARLQPAINEQDVIAAEAAFDWVVFASVDYTRNDRQTTVPVVGGIPLGTGVNASESTRYETGLRTLDPAGGAVSISTDLTKSRNQTPGPFTLSPDPAYDAAIRLGLDQPLLRGFGQEVNEATIMLSRNQTERAVEDLRRDLLQLIADTESAYWDLVFAWRNAMVQEWLVEQGSTVRDSIGNRRELDARSAEFATAVATVEQRKSDVIRARRQVRMASDRLKQLMNDPSISVASEAILRPSETAIDEPIQYSLGEALRTAMVERPEVRQAALNIDDARIRQAVADNATLPQLDLTAQMIYFGLDGGSREAFAELGEANFIEYVVGLAFEVPIGNRAAEAGALRARYERTQSVLAYRQAVQLVVLDVKNALRDVVASYELIEATRSNRIAQAENLRVFIARQPLTGIDPSILDLWLRYQGSLASARIQEVQAVVEYRQAIGELHRAMGTGLDMRGIDLEVQTTSPDATPE